jgi:DNA/RNA endonuclease G (NUC1)
MTPQCGTVNEKSWKDMEEAVRIMAPDYIVTGAVYSSNPYTVGKHKIPVPDSFYKVVYKNKTIKVYVANNVPNALVNEIKIEALEKITKLKFPRY